LQPLRLLGSDFDLAGLPERGERCERIIDSRLRVSLRETPRVRDAGEPQHALRDVAHREADPLRRRLEDHFDGSAAPRHLERKRVGSAAAAFPRAAAPLDLNHVEFRVIDRAPDRRTDLTAARTAEAREAILVSDDARDHEVHSATGVRHPLHHIDVQDLVLGLREQDVHNLRFADRQARPDRVPERRPPFDGRCNPKSRMASVTPLAEARLPARYPVKYAAGRLPVPAAHPRSFNSRDCAVATTRSPVGSATMNCTIVWLSVFRTTTRG